MGWYQIFSDTVICRYWPLLRTAPETSTISSMGTQFHMKLVCQGRYYRYWYRPIPNLVADSWLFITIEQLVLLLTGGSISIFITLHEIIRISWIKLQIFIKFHDSSRKKHGLFQMVEYKNLKVAGSFAAFFLKSLSFSFMKSTSTVNIFHSLCKQEKPSVFTTLFYQMKHSNLFPIIYKQSIGNTLQKAVYFSYDSISVDIVTCQGGGVSSKTRRHGTDKTRSL